MGRSKHTALAFATFSLAYQVGAQFGPPLGLPSSSPNPFFGGPIPTSSEETGIAYEGPAATTPAALGFPSLSDGASEEGGIPTVISTINSYGYPLVITVTSAYPAVASTARNVYDPNRLTRSFGRPQEITYTTTDTLGFRTTITTPLSLAPQRTRPPPVSSDETDSPEPTESLAPTESTTVDSATATSPVAAAPIPQEQTTPAPKKSGISSGAIAAAVVVPIVFVALLLALGFFLLRRRRSKRARRAAEASALAGPESAPSGESTSRGMQEAPSAEKRDFFVDHQIPRTDLDGGAAAATEAAAAAGATPARHPLENVRTNPAPGTFNSEQSTLHSGATPLSTMPGSQGSIGSDPFRDPATGAVLSQSSSGQNAGNWSQFSGQQTGFDRTGYTSPSNEPISPSSDIVSPASDSGGAYFGGGGVSRNASKRSNRALSPIGGDDDESMISEGEVGEVETATAQRASVVQLRRGSGAQLSSTGTSPTTPKLPREL